MRRMKSRLVTVLTVIAMVALLVPAMPASAAITDTGTSGPPVKWAVADAHVMPRGISVKVIGMPDDVTGIDVYRSSSAGALGEKLNAEPVAGDSYVDKTVEPATEYFYTVKVASRDADVDAGRFLMADVLPQVSAVSAAAKAEPVEPKAAKPAQPSPRDVAAPLEARSVKAASAEQVAAMATVIGSAGNVTTLTASKTWTTAMSPIFVRGDLVVPAGKTLTIQPGVKVYFDTVDSGIAPDTKDNPTSGVDLIVHGKLVAKGTASSRVLMTSIMSLATSSTPDWTTPLAGDWGVVFNDSKAASEISYCQIEYGSGCWSRNTARPYYSNNVFQLNATLSKPWGAIYFEQPMTDSVTPRIRITGNSISSPNEGIVVYATDESGGDYGPNRTGDLIVDPYIANNTIKAQYCIDLEAWDGNDAVGNGSSYVRGTVTGNKLFSSSYQPVYLYANCYDGKNAKVSTAFSNNTMSSTDNGAVYSYTYAAEYGKAYNYPTFYGDKITANNSAFDGYAYSDEDTTAVGGAYVRPKFTNCTLVSTEADAVYLYADSDNKGGADVNAVFSGGSVETAGDNAVDGYVESEYGSAAASPSFTNTYVGAHYSNEALYLYAYAYDEGSAKVNPRIVGGRVVNLDDSAAYLYAYSYEATAEAKPYCSNTFIQGYDDCIYAYAYGSVYDGKGNADVSGTFINTKLRIAYNNGSYPAYYGEADAGYKGAAKASPTFNKCDVRGLGEDGVEVYAYSDDGAATASPMFTNGTNVEAYNTAVYAYAERYADDPLLSGTVAASPLIDHSTVKGYNDTAVYAYAYNDGKGDANVLPKLVYGRAENRYYDGAFELEAEKSSGATGTANVSPFVDHSYVFGSDDYAFDIYVNGPGEVAGNGTSKAISGGTYKYSTIENDYYDCIEGEAYNYGGSAYFNPLIQNCTLIATDDNAIDYDVAGYGTGAFEQVCAPTIDRVSMTLTGDSIDLDAYNADIVATSTAKMAPVIKNSNIYATWDYGVQTYARTQGPGKAVNSSYLYNNTIKGYDCIDLEATAYNAGQAENTSKVLGASSKARATVESFDDDGVYQYAWSSLGNAVNTSQAKYLKIDARYDGINAEAAASNASATLSPVIAGNVIGTKWLGDGDGVMVVASGIDTVMSPSVTSNSIGAVSDDGISVDNQVSGHTKFAPVVSGNSIGAGTMGVNGNGLSISNSQARSSEVTTAVTSVTNNTINYPQDAGMRLDYVSNGLVQGNRIASPGYGNNNDWWEISAGIVWYGADSAVAKVRGNMITGARHAVFYEAGWPVTQYNAFGDMYGRTNQPWNLRTDVAAPDPDVDARYNWWGSASSLVASDSIHSVDDINAPASDFVNYTSQLTSVKPLVKSIVKTKSGSTYTFKVTFDRPMNTSVKYLTFGKSSPYKTYKTKVGTWNSAGTMLTVKYTGTIAAGKYYFAGAKDLPGTPMNSTSKYFMP